MANIHVGITDHLDPEVQAMVMAMYSRSYAPIMDRIPSSVESVQEHKEKLGRFYIGYGHRSVGQLGSTTIWLEGVSQLAAKAIENTSLYNGQESSTRYIDFANQPMVSSDKEITYWQEQFRSFYVKAVPLVIEKLKNEFPFDKNSGEYHHKENIDEQNKRKLTVWENTIKARAFDICRGFLPAGCTTNVAFTGTFDLINDHFGEMLYHPSQEMRDIAQNVLTQLKDKYPYGTMSVDKLKERFSYVEPKHFYSKVKDINESHFILNVKKDFEYDNRLKNRKKYEKIDRYNSSNIQLVLKGCLDFGSYRDLQRHRNGDISMEILGVGYGFHKFYIELLPSELVSEISTLINEYTSWYVNNTDIPDIEKQYCTPMGFLVGVQYECDLNQFLYISELRTGKTVHQTLRQLVQFWTKNFLQLFKENVGDIEVHADMDEDNFTLRRGTQTFIV